MLSSLLALSGNSGTAIIVIGAILIGFGIYWLIKRKWLWGILATVGGILLGGLHILDVL